MLKSIKDARKEIYDNYSDKEIMRSELGSLIATLIIIVPYIFISIELTSLFLMKEYMMIPLIDIGYMAASVLYNVFKISILNCYKRTGFKRYLPIIIMNLIISMIFILIVSLILGLIIIPRFVL